MSSKVNRRRLTFCNIWGHLSCDEGTASDLLTDGQGVLDLGKPCWVRRDFCNPGYWLKHPLEDIYPYGNGRGGVDEEWYGCTIPSDNPFRPWDEGEAFVLTGKRNKAFKLAHVVEALGEQFLGDKHVGKFGKRLAFYTKYFANRYRLPLHFHQADDPKLNKPEGYYIPPEMATHPAEEPETYIGLDPCVTKDQLREALRMYPTGDNQILKLSRGYMMGPGTGALMPHNMFHAPAGWPHFEPQADSDIFAMVQSLTTDGWLPPELLVRGTDLRVPERNKPVPDDILDGLMERINFEANTDAHFKGEYFCEPVVASHVEGEHLFRWVTYGQIYGKQEFSVKELRIKPGKKFSFEKHPTCIVVCTRGIGKFGVFPVEAKFPGHRIHELSHDVFAVANRQRVEIENTGQHDLVLLFTFGPEAFPIDQSGVNGMPLIVQAN